MRPPTKETPAEVEQLIHQNRHVAPGNSVRFTHYHREDGRICSVNKTAAGSLRRSKAGWMWTCFRCGEWQVISDDNRSPKATSEFLRKLIRSCAPSKTVHEKPSLPRDFVSLMKHRKSGFNKGIPVKAIRWIAENGIEPTTLEQYNVGWSSQYKRIIFPVFEYAYCGEALCRKLVGWVGRCPFKLNKTMRQQKYTPKYLTKKFKKGTMVYTVPPKTVKNIDQAISKNMVIVVEDIMSAIKVNEYTGAMTMACLTSSVPKDIILKMKDKLILLWLDMDMFNKAVKTAGRYRALGIHTYATYTTHDPKHLAPRDIVTKITEYYRSKRVTFLAAKNKGENVNRDTNS